MSRKFRVGALCLGLVGLSGAVLQHSLVSAQEKSDAGDAAAKELLDAYLKKIQPGPEHARLKMRVGNWKVAGTFYNAPGAPPMKSEARSSIRPVLGGRYFRETYTGEFMGHEFTGLGFFGYDTGLKKYVSTWMDSMSTGIMRSEGTAEESGDTISFVGEHYDPMREQLVKTRYELMLTSRRTHTATMYEVSADGSERKMMELVYTRAKGGKKKGDRKPQQKKRKEKDRQKKQKKGKESS